MPWITSSQKGEMSILKVKCLPWSLTLLEADLKSRPSLPVPPEVFLLWWREKVTQVGHSSLSFMLHWIYLMPVVFKMLFRTFYFSVLLFSMSYSIPQNNPSGFMCLCFHLEFKSGFLFWSGSKCGQQSLSTHRTTTGGQRANCRPRNIV